MTQTPGIWARLTGRPNFGWKTRHLLVLILASLGTYGFLESRLHWSEMHRWNRAIGDMSIILIAISIAIGPLSRLWKHFRTTLAWRREMGIYGVLLAIIHTLIILTGWLQWDLVRLFGYELHPATGLYVMVKHGFGLANIIGVVALLYGIVLALSSNDWSQRVLSGSVWKFLQQGAYILWILIVIHTAYFLYLHFQDFHRAVPKPNWAQLPFVGLIIFVSLLQFLAFMKTWKIKRKPVLMQANSTTVTPQLGAQAKP